MFAVLLILSCGAGASQRPERDVDQHLAVEAARLKAGGEIIEITAMGAVRANGKRVGTVHGDGRFVDTQGNLVATLDADGRITRASGALLEEVVIDERGVLFMHGKRIQIRSDGGVAGAGVASLDLSIEVSASGRRAAMYVLLLAALSAPS